MSEDTPRDRTAQAKIEALLEEYKRGAKLSHVGALLESEDIQQQAFAMHKGALAKLEALSPLGRNVILPLLSDPDPEIRVIACAHLVTRHPQLVLPILGEIIEERWTEAAQAARNTRMLYEMGLYEGH